MSEDKKLKIMVILHGGIGNFVLASGAFAAIREEYKNDEITLLTTPPLQEMAAASPYFDKIWIDNLPSWWEVKKWWNLLQLIRQEKFNGIYDLQNSTRTNLYFRGLGHGRPAWSGSISWCSHPHNNMEKDSLHIIERHEDQLKYAGIKNTSRPTLSWLKADISKFNIEGKYALIVPGNSGKRLDKRWEDEEYIKVMEYLEDRDIRPVFIGSHQDEDAIDRILSKCVSTNALNLCLQTSLSELAELARGASIAIGGETGPMKLIAMARCPSIFLFSPALSSELYMPIGEHIMIVARHSLDNIYAEDVTVEIEQLMQSKTSDKSSNSEKVS